MLPESFENGTIHTFHPRIHGGDIQVKLPTGLRQPFIPAYAGEIDSYITRPLHPRIRGGDQSFSGSARAASFHPRIRGGDWTAGDISSIQRLSSPHTRGELLRASRAEGYAPFIPAYTGEIDSYITRPPHPRIRGGNGCSRRSRGYRRLSSPHTRGRRMGSPGSLHFPLSSPHTRGRPARRYPALVCRPFIPAYTGETVL